jgi:hypothetical protein
MTSPGRQSSVVHRRRRRRQRSKVKDDETGWIWFGSRLPHFRSRKKMWMSNHSDQRNEYGDANIRCDMATNNAKGRNLREEDSVRILE